MEKENPKLHPFPNFDPKKPNTWVEPLVYGFPSGSFLDYSQELLDKLEEKGYWDKDTLVIALDKAVRPLAYTLRKLSKEESKEIPEIRYLNYSSKEGRGEGDEGIEKGEVDKHIDKKTEKLLNKKKKILFLDEYADSGMTFKNLYSVLCSSKKFPEKYKKSNYKEIPPFPKTIHFASLDSGYGSKKRLTNLSPKDNEKDPDFSYISNMHWSVDKGPAQELGVTDADNPKSIKSKAIRSTDYIPKNMKKDYEEYIPKERIKAYKEFVQERKQLSSAIKNYVILKGLKKGRSNEGGLEKSMKSFSFLLIISGILFSSFNITGNVIGSLSDSTPLGIVLMILGILGILLSKKIHN